MKEIIKLVVMMVAGLFLIVRCGIKDKIEKQENARRKAEFIMQNLGKKM